MPISGSAGRQAFVTKHTSTGSEGDIGAYLASSSSHLTPPVTTPSVSASSYSSYAPSSSSPYKDSNKPHKSSTPNGGHGRLSHIPLQILSICLKLAKVAIFHPIRFIRTTLLGKTILCVLLIYALLTTSVSYYEINTADVNKHLTSTVQDIYKSATRSSSKYLYNSYDSKEFENPTNRYQPDASLRTLLRESDSYVFQWRDWMDLTQVQSLMDSIETVRQSSYAWIFPWTAQLTGHSFSKPPTQRAVEQQQSRIGNSYMDLYGTIPSKIVLVNSNLTDRGENTVFYVASNRTKIATTTPDSVDDSAKLLLADRSQDIVAYEKVVQKFGKVATGRALFDIIESSPDLQPIPQALVPVEERQFLHLTQDDFIFDLEKHVNFTGIANPNDVTDEAKINSVKVQEYLNEVEKSPKFFYEVMLRNDRRAHGAHYDWRFFKHVRRSNDKRDTLHHLVRTWLQFTENEGIISWISHGTLLGWYWNGLTMPWDTDGDIQMPIKELDRFARRYNGTLVVQDPTEGDGRYFIEVGSWYVERSRGNGNNIIDARFIDTRSGMYLDITGLTYAETPKGETLKNLRKPEDRVVGENKQKPKSKWDGLPQFGCKNGHRYNLDEISPLRRTLFEGVPAYIPNAYTELLRREYPKGLTSNKYQSFHFISPIQDWVTDDRCEELTVEFYEEDYKMTAREYVDSSSVSTKARSLSNIEESTSSTPSISVREEKLEAENLDTQNAPKEPTEKEKEKEEREKKEKEEREKKEKEEREKKEKEEREKKEKEEREKKEKEEHEKKEKKDREMEKKDNEKKEKEEYEKKEKEEHEKKEKEEHEKKEKEEREKKEREEREKKRKAILQDIMDKSFDKDTKKLSLFGACGDEKFLNFYNEHSLPVTNMHQREMDAIKNNQSTWEFIKDSFPIIRPNPLP